MATVESRRSRSPDKPNIREYTDLPSPILENEKAPLNTIRWVPRDIHTGGYTTYVDDLMHAVLINRGLRMEDGKFLVDPKMPSAEEAGIDILSLQNAGERFKKAAENNESVLIYGDSDVDGIFSTVITYHMLKSFGIDNITTATPARDSYGFGFNTHAANEYGGKYDLIISIDCGVTGQEQVDIARSKGSEVLVIDHHLAPKDEYPTDTTIIHTRETSAAGIAYLMSNYYEEAFGITPPDMVGLAGFAVFTDSMSMTKVNHPIVKKGLQNLREKQPKFLTALAEANGTRQNEIANTLSHLSETDISFTYAPLMNLLGRYGEPEKALEFMLTKNRVRQIEIAEEMVRKNIQRKIDSDELRKKVREMMTPKSKFLLHTIEENEYDWPPTFVDPITSSLMMNPEVNMPVMIGKVHQSKEFDEKVIIYQIRTPNGLVNVQDFIHTIKDKGLCIRGGGHASVAGLTVFEKDREEVKRFARSFFNKNIDKIPPKEIQYDAEIPLSKEFHSKIVKAQNKIRPFSYQLHAPIYLSRNINVVKKEVRQNKNNPNQKHLYVTLKDEAQNSNETFVAKMFNADEKYFSLEQGDKIDLLYKIDEHYYNGNTDIEIKPEAIRYSEETNETPTLWWFPQRQYEISNDFYDTEYVNVPNAVEKRLRKINLAAFDMDDTVKIPDPWTTQLRRMCFEAWHFTKDDYFRSAYHLVQPGTQEEKDLHIRIQKVSCEVYTKTSPHSPKDTEWYDHLDFPYSIKSFNGRLLTPGEIHPKDRIQYNAFRYSHGFRTDDERTEIYYENMGFTTPEEYMDYYLNRFNNTLTRRVDEFAYVAPGAVEVLNYLTNERQMEISLISNSKSSDLLSFETILQQDGFDSSFAHKISANSMSKHKPDPYALRNLMLHYSTDKPITMVYIGNSTGDIAFADRFSNTTDFPSPHTLEYNKIDMVPVIITRGLDYSEFDLPDHAEFGSLQALEKYLRDILPPMEETIFTNFDQLINEL